MAVSVAVCEIFSVKAWCDLENRVRSNWSLEMAPFDRLHTIASSIVTIALCCITRYYELLVKNCEIFIPHLYLAPSQGGGWPRLNFANLFDNCKTRMIGLLCVEETITTCFHLIPACDGRTDRQTEFLYQYRAGADPGICVRGPLLFPPPSLSSSPSFPFPSPPFLSNPIPFPPFPSP